MDDPVSVTIGGATYLCPPMPFYCLERAWPHIQRLGQMGLLNQAAVDARTALTYATADARPAAQAALDAATNAVNAGEADFVAQTRAALCVIAAALALSVPPPTYDDLAKRLRPDELVGVHQAVTLLIEASGLTATGRPGAGEASAMSRPAPSNGLDSSPNWLPTA